MSLEQPEFVNFIESLFKENGSDYQKIKEKFHEIFSDNPRERDRLAIYAHFYYFICTPNLNPSSNTKIREELQLVGVASLIEAMTVEIDYEYKDFCDYFEDNFPGKNSIDNYNLVKEEYRAAHGISKRIRNYFKEYISKEEAYSVINGIRVWDETNGKMIPMKKDTDELANFIYQMRSDFVHRAEMRYLCPLDVDGAFLVIGKKWYELDKSVNILGFLKLFEKSFVKYWEKKYNELLKKL